MKEFLLKTLAFFLVFSAINLALFASYRIHPNHFVHAYGDKEKLLKETKKPRIILIGDSNLVLGINSELIQNATGHNIVNAAMQGSLGLQLSLDLAAKYLNSGDIVVVIPNYRAFGAQFYGSNNRYALYLKAYPSMIQHVRSKEQLQQILLGIPQMGFASLKRGFAVSNLSRYTRDGFNQFGDYIAHYGQSPTFSSKKDREQQLWSKEMPKFLPRAIRGLNLFSQEQSRRDIKVYFSFPAYPTSRYQRHQQEITAFESHLQKELAMPVLGSVRRFVFDDRLFFDSEYHLIEDGVRLRSNTLAKELRRALSSTVP